MRPQKFLQSVVAILISILLIRYSNLPRKAAAWVDGMSSSADATTAHYIVFEKRTGGAVEPVFYRLVALDAPLKSLSAAQLDEALAQPARNTSSIIVTLRSPKNEIVYRDVVSYSPWLRGEFHGETPGAPIDGHLIPLESSSFVVRLPVLEGASLTLEDTDQQVLGVFDLAQLAYQTPEIDLPRSQVMTVKEALSGPPANRVDFLIMGDGYTDAQLSDFTADASAVANEFFSISPYAEYFNYFNILTLFTPSTQSGADHPTYNPACGYSDPTCCGDPDMQSDPYEGQIVNTAFDSRFCAYRIHRLLVTNTSKVLAAAGAEPDWDTIVVLVNDPTYGGSGGTIATVSTHSAAAEIAQHEYGHSFVDLADEYVSAYPGYQACSDISGSSAPCEDNVTDISVRAQIKWYPWIQPTTPIPTSNDILYDGLVGLFEGARYQSTGMYRSGYRCIMRELGVPFCQVPSQSFVLKLYNGGWGVPGGGISLIEPDTLSPSGPIVNLIHPATQVFHADILSPVGGPPAQITWLINGTPDPTVITDTYTYTTSSPGTIQITLHVKDVTTLVNPVMGGNAVEDSFTWNVNVTTTQQVDLIAVPAELVADGFSQSIVTATVTYRSTPVVGETVMFTTTLGSLNPLAGVTDAAGVVTTTLTSTPSLGTATILASTAIATGIFSIDFVAGAPVSITVSPVPGSIQADGVSQSLVTAFVADASGNPVDGVTVTFTATLGTLQPITITTDLNGQATTTFTAGTSPGTATITATAQTLNGSATVILTNRVYELYLSLIRKP